MFKFYLIGAFVAFALSLYTEIKTSKKATISGSIAIVIATLFSWLSVVLGITVVLIYKILGPNAE